MRKMVIYRGAGDTPRTLAGNRQVSWGSERASDLPQSHS